MCIRDSPGIGYPSSPGRRRCFMISVLTEPPAVLLCEVWKVLESVTTSLEAFVKAEIHPQYTESTVSCSCGAKFTTQSTLPEIKVEICSECHPFYTCLLYTSDAVDDLTRVDLGGRRIIKKKKKYNKDSPVSINNI